MEKAGKKINAIARVGQCMNFSKRKILMDVFFVSLNGTSSIVY